MKRISAPNPLWKAGDKLVPPFSEYDSLAVNTLDSTAVYKLLIGSVVPRPIAFVSTQSADGKNNLAPFSFFNAVGSNPPSLMFSVTRKSPGVWKDTARNILETGEFVVNSVSRWMAEPMNFCAADFEYGVSELEKAGFTALASQSIKPVRVAEAGIQMECKLYQSVQVGGEEMGSALVIIGEIVRMHFGKGILVNGKINLEALDPISRLAGFDYCTVSEVFEIARKKSPT